MSNDITPDILLAAYKEGVFPMGDSRDDPQIYWYQPKQRGIIPLDKFHLSKRLARTIFSNHYQIKIDQSFDAVIDCCAASACGRETTWINQTIRTLYGQLFEQGYVHTVEVWDGGQLVGGLYGVAVGQVFCGESMFSRQRDVSKIALVYLVAWLRLGGFNLLDTQFLTSHLAQFGAIEMDNNLYYQELKKFVDQPAIWLDDTHISDILHEIRKMRHLSIEQN